MWFTKFCCAGKLLIPYVNGLELCDPLGDKTVWGSMFKLEKERISNGSIMLATKVSCVCVCMRVCIGFL